MDLDEIVEGRNDDVMRKFLVTLEREIMVCQYQEAEIEVEAASEGDAERRAILAVEDEDFDDEEWEVIDCNGPSQLLHTPSVIATEEISGR